MTALSLGIDIGTSGIRTAVLNEDGELVSSARVAPMPMQTDQIDAMNWWLSVKACLSVQFEALPTLGHTPKDVVRIGVDGTSGTMVLTDANMRPVTPALMYNSAGFDLEADVIARHAPQIHITKGANSALARALRLQSLDSEGKAVHLLHQADFVIAQLRARGGVSDYNNALKTGFDPQTEAWPDWFKKTGLNVDLLPTPLPPGAPIGPISGAVAQDLGLRPETQIHAGTTDSIAAFLAAAPLKTGVAVTSLGTTLAVKVLGTKRIDDPSIGLYSHRLGDFWLAGGASNTGGGVLAALFDTDQLIGLSHRINPDVPSPLNYYPLLAPGERFPFNDPQYRPRMEPRPGSDVEFLHGLLEGIARIEAQCYAAIKKRGGEYPSRIFTAGGGASNSKWTTIRSRLLDVQPEQAQHTEAAIGIARLIMDHAS